MEVSLILGPREEIWIGIGSILIPERLACVDGARQVRASRQEKALRILQKIGGEAYAKQAGKEISRSLEGADLGVKLKPLLSKGVRPIVLIGIVLAVFQQWCGINVVFNYAEEVFSAAGYEVSDILFNIVITGVVNLIFTFVAIRTVDRWGRRRLMLIGSLGLALLFLRCAVPSPPPVEFQRGPALLTTRLPWLGACGC